MKNNQNKNRSNKEWKNIFSERLSKFSVNIILLANRLPKTPAGFAVASQMIRAGTSVGANFGEAQDASSPRDFVQKLNIALREAKETCYWLQIIQMSKLLFVNNAQKELHECEEIIAILTASVKSAKVRVQHEK